MTLQRKIHILIFACLILFSGVLLFFREIQSRQSDLIVNSAELKLQEIVKNSVNIQSSHLKQIVADYTNWDGIIDHIDKYDKTWSDNSIATIINSYKLSSLVVCNLDHNVVYQYGETPSEILGNSIQQKRIFSQIDSLGFFHFYRKTSKGILEISAATIHPTNDQKRITPKRGYFFISKLWDEDFFKDLPLAKGNMVTIATADFKSTNSADKYEITTSLPIFDYDQRPIYTLVVQEPNKLLESYHEISFFVMNFLAFMIVFVLSVFFFILFLWVRRPLLIISETLLKGDTRPLKALKKNKDEFSQIAGLIMNFDNQRKELESENLERKIAQKELAKSSELMLALADASSRLLIVDNLEDSIKNALESIVEHANVDRIIIMKNVFDDRNTIEHVEIFYDWIRPEYQSAFNGNSDDIALKLHIGGNWFSRFNEGQMIKGLDSDDKLHQLFSNILTKSSIVAPIIDPINLSFWGFVSFSDNYGGRTWNLSYENGLTMLANNIGVSIRRYILNSELKDALELARSADKAKSNFLASMSHEIRTPMNGVIGMTSLLLQSDLTPSQREYVQTIETSGESLLNIINEILDFSKIESGTIVLEKSAFDLRKCIEDVLDLMASKIFEKRLEIIYFIDPEISEFIFGDGFRLRQVLVNLLGNALKFTESGEILLRVRLKAQLDESIKLEFSVKDSGIGIPSEKLKNLFEPFTQVDASTTRKYGGSGLGLAISARLVELMEGEISVESQVGEGSTFFFTITTNFIKEPENSHHVVDQLLRYKSKKVLVVDDNKTNRRILQLQLKCWNIETVAVQSGFEALALLDNNARFDAAILDMQMPEMDGETLAQEIRKRQSKVDLPLIMLTSIGFTIRKTEIQQLFSFYVNKPIKHSRLAEILVSVFNKDKEVEIKNLDNEVVMSNISTIYPFEILIAEDNFINQKLIRKLFEVLGYKTDLVANGYEAIDALKRKKFHLIFMDIQMPEMDGYEATKLIIERWGTNAPVIIAMTANAMQGDKEKCFQAGMSDYISKPLRLQDLAKLISKWGELQKHLFDRHNTD